MRLVRPRSLAFVDLPGHGLGTSDKTGIAESGPGLAALAGRGTYVGYSMGGRFALTTAVTSLDSVDRLVLVGATPGIDDETERAERLARDRRLADRVVEIGTDAFLDEWLALPMFSGLPPDPIGLEHRRRNTADGLAHSLRHCGTGSQPSLWGRLDRID